MPSGSRHSNLDGYRQVKSVVHKRRGGIAPKWLRAAALALLLAPILIACGQDEKPARVDFSKRETVGYEEPAHTITYAYVPQYFHRVSFERHDPLIQHLKRETGLPIRQVFPDSFDEFIRMTGQGKIDISFANPFIYVKVAQRFGSRVFARIIEMDGREGFRGQIICRSDDARIRTLADCKGKRWVAVDASSAGGYLYALGHFFDHGIRKEDFADISFVSGPGGQQEKVVLAVYNGKYDIGSVREGALQLLADKIDLSRIRTLAYTSWYPGWVYVARAGLAPNVLSAIKTALLKLDCQSVEHRDICDAAHFAGVLPADDSDCDSIRRLAAKVGVDLNE